jgi:hypothetical protein
MNDYIQLDDINDVYPAARARLRQVRPSLWNRRGLRRPKSGKFRVFYIKHTDLVEWAGGLDALKGKGMTPDQAFDYLWEVYDRQVRFVYHYFQEVMDPREDRMRAYCNQHLA